LGWGGTPPRGGGGRFLCEEGIENGAGDLNRSGGQGLRL